MNASVICLFLVIAGATTVSLATTPTPKATTAKVTVHTTAERPTTVPKTTHNHPTATPKTTNSRPTTAPKTTHSHPTTDPKTITTHMPQTTSHHRPGNATTSSTHTTAAAGNTTSNATGSTVGTTTPAGTTRPGPEKVIPSYQFENGSEVKMLFVMNATLKIRYNTTNNETGEVTIPIGGKLNATGVEWTANFSDWSSHVSLRRFIILAFVPVSNETSALGLDLIFSKNRPWHVSEYPLYNGSVSAIWDYSEPIFPRDVVNYGTHGQTDFWNVYTGRMGTTYGCSNLTLTAGPATIIMDHVMFQPWADYANGTFGDGIQDCMGPPPTLKPTTIKPRTMKPTTMEPTTANATMATTASPHPPSKPSPNNGGMIAGIVIGVLVFVALIVGIAVFVVRKRRMKEAAYGHLDEEHKDYVH